MKLTPTTRLEDLPIPENVRPTQLWPGQLLELAAHIGPYAALVMIDRIGGQYFYVPHDPARNALAAIIGEEKAAIVSRVYGGERIDWVRAERAIHEAKRAAVIAAIREGTLTIAAAVPILRLTRTTISRLVNHSTEGLESRAWVPLPAPERSSSQLDLFS